jgi:hypothetical protein
MTTMRSKVYPEKLTVAQLVNKYHTFYPLTEQKGPFPWTQEPVNSFYRLEMTPNANFQTSLTNL